MVGQLPKLLGYTSEASEFFPRAAEFVESFTAAHIPTLTLGGASLVVLVLLRRWAPRLPGALIVAALGIAAVAALGLHDRGVAVLGPVPAGFPIPRLPSAPSPSSRSCFATRPASC